MRIRMGVAAIILFTGVSLALGAGIGILIGKPSPHAEGSEELIARVESLEEALRSKEQQIRDQNTELTEMADSLEKAQQMADAGADPEFTQPAQSSSLGARGPGESDSQRFARAAPSPSTQDHNDQSGADEQSEPAAAGPHASAVSPPPPRPRLSFNAQDLTAVRDTKNEGKLSFRLVKDRPDVFFEGYLFVYVETRDMRGSSRLKVYPQNAKLGEGDFPVNYKAGQFVGFKANSKVRLDDVPLDGRGADSRLKRVVVLLYSKNGGIVFQREFDGREINRISRTSTAIRDTSQKNRRRRAL
jgi:hypothetical protein